MLPFVAVGVVWTGLDSPAAWASFLAVLAANGLAFYVGHPHRADASA